jgi:nitroreductase
MLADLVRENRSYRRFYQDVAVGRETLRDLVALARLSATASNLQPLKFILSCSPDTNATIFRHLHWAGYLKDWAGPKEGERPAAYVIILGDRSIRKKFSCDHGIAAQTMLLGAVELGLGGCMLARVDQDDLRKALRIPDQYEIQLVVALGKPKETVVIEDLGTDGDIKYFRDAVGVHHVPKRSMDELILREY